VIHLMVAGRLHWKKPGAALPRRRTHAAFDFSSGTLLLSEASTRKRARLHLVRGRDGLAAQPGRAKGATTAGLAALPVGAGEREEHSGYNGPP
jgi:formamidopyrimidine-DNA glycosylase